LQSEHPLSNDLTLQHDRVLYWITEAMPILRTVLLVHGADVERATEISFQQNVLVAQVDSGRDPLRRIDLNSAASHGGSLFLREQ
jgi:hypothetical protein